MGKLNFLIDLIKDPATRFYYLSAQDSNSLCIFSATWY